MTADNISPTRHVLVDGNGLDHLIHLLGSLGFAVIGPTVTDGAVVLSQLEGVRDLPRGLRAAHRPGEYRLSETDDDRRFEYGPTPQGFKPFLYPASEKLWSAEATGNGMSFAASEAPSPEMAFFGVRPCDLKGIAALDRVFTEGHYPHYHPRRSAAFIIAVNCTRACGTGFCASMEAGPKAKGGFDLALTEIDREGEIAYLVEVGSARASEIIDGITTTPASPADIQAGNDAVAAAESALDREMIADVRDVLKRNLEHHNWASIAERCLGCGNCTMVCPTCFCSTIEDRTDLSGAVAEQWRRWDSCFTIGFSYVHGGSIRRDGATRYRQWMTHKLDTWWEQFDCSGCVGCGRCITWCPVGIDITEEARLIKASEQGESHAGH